MLAVWYHELWHEVGHEGIAAEGRHVGADDGEDLADERVQEAAQATVLQKTLSYFDEITDGWIEYVIKPVTS